MLQWTSCYNGLIEAYSFLFIFFSSFYVDLHFTRVEKILEEIEVFCKRTGYSAFTFHRNGKGERRRAHACRRICHPARAAVEDEDFAGPAYRHRLVGVCVQECWNEWNDGFAVGGYASRLGLQDG